MHRKWCNPEVFNFQLPGFARLRYNFAYSSLLLTGVAPAQHPSRNPRCRFRESESTMATLPVRHERRAAQRFDFHLPVSIRQCNSGSEEVGFTQNISARGAFIYTDTQMSEGADIELTLMMPSEITLAENMRVRCKGKVLRVSKATPGSKAGVAVHLDGYEFLPDQPASMSESSFQRISSLHGHPLAENETPAPRAIPRRPTLL